MCFLKADLAAERGINRLDNMAMEVDTGGRLGDQWERKAEKVRREEEGKGKRNATMIRRRVDGWIDW